MNVMLYSRTSNAFLNLEKVLLIIPVVITQCCHLEYLISIQILNSSIYKITKIDGPLPNITRGTHSVTAPLFEYSTQPVILHNW